MRALSSLIPATRRADALRFKSLSSHVIEMAEARISHASSRQRAIYLRVRINRQKPGAHSFYDFPSIEDGDALMANVSLEKLRQEENISQLQYEILSNAINKAQLYTACDGDVADYIA